MAEKDIEQFLLQKLAKSELKGLVITSAHDSLVRNLGDLVGNNKFQVFHDDNRWNPNPGVGRDVIGGMVPDIVLRSLKSGQNRIYIEVKETDHLRYDKEDSQIIRYFLHLVFTTKKEPNEDIQRAILLAAPSAWFTDVTNAEKWQHFLDNYGGLASRFDVTLGEIHLCNSCKKAVLDRNRVCPTCR
jgi:hypothetical protein